jgi:hypothetical protein
MDQCLLAYMPSVVGHMYTILEANDTKLNYKVLCVLKQIHLRTDEFSSKTREVIL